MIVDGDEGLVVLDPDEPTQERYRRAAAERAARFRGLAGLAGLPAETLDGVRVDLWGNIEFPTEVAGCLERGARGVGLYRTEFLFLSSDRPPTEEEQFEAYAAVVRSLQGRPVTIRTLDLGADKLVSYRTAGYDEPNPVARAAEPAAARCATRRCSGSSSARSSGPAPWATCGSCSRW